jgi:hypothetical protein
VARFFTPNLKRGDHPQFQFQGVDGFDYTKRDGRPSNVKSRSRWAGLSWLVSGLRKNGGATLVYIETLAFFPN